MDSRGVKLKNKGYPNYIHEHEKEDEYYDEDYYTYDYNKDMQK